MHHIHNGVLRSVHDFPLSTDSATARHLSACESCQIRGASIAADARFAADRLRFDDRVDAKAAYARFVSRPPKAEQSPQRFGLPIGIAVAAALAICCISTPIRTYAANMLAIFRPTQFVAIMMSNDTLRSISLHAYGDFTTVRGAVQGRIVTRAQAARETGYAIRRPRAIPRNISQPGYLVFQPGITRSFRFNARKAAKARMPLVIPPALDGATITFVVRSLIIDYYGNGQHRNGEGKFVSDGPPMRFVQVAVPEIRTHGATLEQLRSYLLAQPGLPDAVKRQFESIADPLHTLPIPVQIDRRTATAVAVDGVKGLAIGDTAGSSTIMWQKNGMMYIVAGKYKKDTLVAVANSLR